MINKKSERALSNSSHSNFLSEAVTIDGTFTSEQDAIIAGTINGDVRVKGLLKLEKNGFVKGSVFATNADISGKINGEVRCEIKAVFRKTSVIKADLYAKTFQVEADAVIDGNIHMSKTALNSK
jgi:cytoskeletal protein CcmA (bactofilin family)